MLSSCIAAVTWSLSSLAAACALLRQLAAPRPCKPACSFFFLACAGRRDRWRRPAAAAAPTASRVRRQFFRRDAEFARGAWIASSRASTSRRRAGIELDPVEVIVQRIHRFLQLDAGRLQQSSTGLQLRRRCRPACPASGSATTAATGSDGRDSEIAASASCAPSIRLAACDSRLCSLLISFHSPGLAASFSSSLDLPFEAFALEQHVLRIGLEFLALAAPARARLVGGRHGLRLGAGAGVLKPAWLSSSARCASASAATGARAGHGCRPASRPGRATAWRWRRCR